MENAKKILKCWPLHVTLLIVVFACEWINTIKIPTPVGNILLLPMLYAIVITLVLSLQKPIKWMKQEASEVSSDFVVFGISLFLAKVAVTSGTQIQQVIEAGPALIQEAMQTAVPEQLFWHCRLHCFLDSREKQLV